MFSSKTNFSMLSICFWDNIVYNKQVKNENNGIPKKVPIMEDGFFGTVENPCFSGFGNWGNWGNWGNLRHNWKCI